MRHVCCFPRTLTAGPAAPHTTRAQVEEPEARRTLRQKRFNGYGENFRCACVCVRVF
jgi:hypothetical protein